MIPLHLLPSRQNFSSGIFEANKELLDKKKNSERIISLLYVAIDIETKKKYKHRTGKKIRGCNSTSSGRDSEASQAVMCAFRRMSVVLLVRPKTLRDLFHFISGLTEPPHKNQAPNDKCTCAAWCLYLLDSWLQRLRFSFEKAAYLTSVCNTTN